MASDRAPFETSKYQFLEKVFLYFLYEFLKFYSKEMVSELSEFFRKKSTFFGHMIHHIYVEFPYDLEYGL